jgi:hypothetical protein
LATTWKYLIKLATKKSYNGREDEEEEISGYWMFLRKRKYTAIGTRKN